MRLSINSRPQTTDRYSEGWSFMPPNDCRFESKRLPAVTLSYVSMFPLGYQCLPYFIVD
jgi:hypothetical protein